MTEDHLHLCNIVKINVLKNNDVRYLLKYDHLEVMVRHRGKAKESGSQFLLDSISPQFCGQRSLLQVMDLLLVCIHQALDTVLDIL